MSMQNLTTSANFPMFTKVHQQDATQQSPRMSASVSAGDGDQQGKGQHSQLSAADLHQMMLSQLDQQLYLSQLAGLGSSDAAPPAEPSSSVNPFPHFASSIDLPTSSAAAACNASDSATTTTSSASSTSSTADVKPFPTSGGVYGVDSTTTVPSSADLLGHQLTHQKLMEQFLEVATTVAGGAGQQQQQLRGASTTPSAEEMMVSQLMAQLVNGTSMPGGGGGGGETTHGHGTASQQQQQQFMGARGDGQPQQQQQSKTDGTQSPSSSHNQQQMSMALLDQLQLLQMLGANSSSLPGFAELFAASGLPSSASSENLAQLLKGVGGAGGSPSKAEQVYCDQCDKWLCNRYFLKTHMLKKHGIGEATSTTNSPLKNGVGNFSFGSSAQFSADENVAAVRSNSVSVQPPQMELTTAHRNESPPIGRLAPKLSLSSTPGGTMCGGTVPGDNTTTAFNEALSPDHSQQMAVMQQLAAQFAFSNGGNADGERNALFEQIFGSGGLHLAELMGHSHNQQQQNIDMNRCAASPSSVRSPPVTLSGSGDYAHQSQQNVSSVAASSSSSFPCAQCAKSFASQAALFQHQLAVHIGSGTDAPQQPQQQSNGADAQSSSFNNALAVLAAAGINGGNAAGTQQQQQLFGQLLGSNPFSQGTAPSLMFNNPSAFGGINASEFDGAAMLAKLSAEFAAVAQAHQGQGGGAVSAAVAQAAGGQAQQNCAPLGARGQTPAPSNKPPPQKRQYSSTSKNFCDLCNKEVCNKYFLRTHMLKMHNIVIDENKQLIANIDTVDKERKGEVKFRCDICHVSMNTREELKLHKRESHGMHAGSGGSQSTPLGGSRGTQKASSSAAAAQSTPVAMDSCTEGNQQQKAVAVPSFPAPASHFSAVEHQQQQQSTHQRRATSSEGGTTTVGTNDENQPLGEQQQTTRRGDSAGGAQQPSLVGANPMKQLLSLIGGGDEALPPSLVSGARPLRTTNIVKKETAEEEHHLGHCIADANNNATNCRFCGLCLEEEGQLQLHQLMEHPNEYMAELQPTVVDMQQANTTEDKLINQVALQMAEANSHQLQHHNHHQQRQQFQQRKTSVASSGASSSSAASFGDIGTAHPAALLQQRTTKKSGTPLRGPNAAGGSDARGDGEGGGGERHQCPQCKRMYKSVQKMERHQRVVHHNLVGRLSPTKRAVISPKKIAKLMTSFSCHKCRRRFSSRVECDEHVISHLRSERLKHEEAEEGQQQQEEEGEEGAVGGSGPQVKRAKVGEEDGVGERRSQRGDQVGTAGAKTATNDDGAGEGQQRQQHGQRRTTKGAASGEKHSHTSGSTSPVSVQAGSSGVCALPEGFAHPLLDHSKPFVLQSFTLRPVSPRPSTSELPDELVAYLPVRSTLGQPIRVTFELSPTPLVDRQVQHL